MGKCTSLQTEKNGNMTVQTSRHSGEQSRWSDLSDRKAF